MVIGDVLEYNITNLLLFFDIESFRDKLEGRQFVVVHYTRLSVVRVYPS